MCMSSYFREQGILPGTSCVGTPQQNGQVECKHRHILNVARALRFQASLPIEFWGECILTAAYLINRTPTPLLDGQTPFERLYKQPPPLAHLRTFGCLCYAHNQNHKGDKFASRSIKGVFIGYPYGKNGWRVLNPLTGNIFASRDVFFCESQFPYSIAPPTESSPSPPLITKIALPEEEVTVPLAPVLQVSSDTALTDQELPTLSTDDTQVSSDIETETGDDSTPLPSTDLPESSTPPTTVTETENAEIADDNTNPSPDILHISIILSIRPCAF